MPEQNQPIQGNFGDIYRVETPTLDRVSQQLQAQYAARQAFNQKETLNTEDLLNKEMANVRSVDAPQVFDAYNRYKELSKNLLFNKSIQANPRAYSTAQMEANSAYANAMGLVNKSTQLNQFGKQLLNDRSTPGRSNLYADDFGDKTTAFWGTPMDELQNNKLGDLSNQDTYRYKGSQTNFADLEKKAAGSPTQKYQKEDVVSPLQKNITPYSFGNTPAQYQDLLRGSYSSNKQTYRDANAAWETIPQAEKDRVDQQFSQLPPEKWQQMGLSGPQAIAPINPQDPADNLAAYKAKVYAINNNPTAGKVYSNVDQSAKINLQSKDRLQASEVMEAMREGNREKQLAIKHQYKQLDVKEQSRVLNETIGTMIDKAKADPDKKIFTQSNPGDVSSITPEYKLDVGPELKKALSIEDPEDSKHRIDADDVVYNESKGTVTPIFYLSGKPHTLANIDRTYSKPMTIGEFKATYGKTYFGVREAAKESTNTQTGGSGLQWK